MTIGFADARKVPSKCVKPGDVIRFADLRERVNHVSLKGDIITFDVTRYFPQGPSAEVFFHAGFESEQTVEYNQESI